MIDGTELNLRTRLSQAAARALPREPAWQNLEVLSLWSNKLSAKSLDFLLREPPPGLRTLEIVDNGLGIDGAKRVAAALPWLGRLEALDLRNNGLGVAGLEVLLGAGLGTVRRLGLRENQLGSEGAALLAACGLPSLEILHIGANDLGDAGMLALAPLVGRLVELRSGDNRLGAEGMAAIAAAKRLEVLDVERNWCGPTGAQALAGIDAPLRELDLYWNDIGPDGAQALFGERAYPKLERLELRANKLGDAGAEALATSSMPRLERLSVEDNAIGPRGTAALARSAILTSVRALALHSNQFGPEGVEALLTSPTLPRATREEAAKVLRNYVDDAQVAAIATRRGVAVGADKLETLLAVVGTT